MADKIIGREAVQNPFDMGPNTSFQQPGRQMKEFRPLSRSAFQASDTGMKIVDSLLNFSEVSGSVVVDTLNKKIAEDKILQSAQAELGLVPTSKATVAGVRAHAATIMQDKLSEQKIRLNDLASKGLTPEQWKEEVSTSYQSVNKYLDDNYPNYKTDRDMQKLLPVAFREMMPQLNTIKQAGDLELITTKGKQAVTDELIRTSKLIDQSGTGLTPEQLSGIISQKLGPLRLTSDEKDKIVESVVINSNSTRMIEASKLWKGDRKSNLFDRSGNIQTLEKQMANRKTVIDGVEFELAQQELKKNAIAGTITKDQFISQAKLLRKSSGDKYPGRGFVEETLDKIDKQRLSDSIMSSDIQSFMDGDTYKLKNKKPKELEAMYDKISSVNMEASQEEARNELPNGTQSEVDDLAHKKFTAKSQKLLQRSVEQGHTPNSVINRLNQVAVLNFGESISDQKRATGGVQEKLDPSIEKELQFVDSIPTAARHAVLNDMDGKNKDVIEIYWNEMAKGTPSALAIERAQRQANEPKPVDNIKINEASNNIIGSLERGLPWLFGNKDYPDNQQDIVKKYVSNMLFQSADPLGESTQKSVTAAIKSYAKTDSGRVFLGMTPDKLYEMTNIDITHVDSGVDRLIQDNMDRLGPILENSGLEQKDVSLMPFPDQGYFRLVGPSGELLSTKRFKFSEIGEAANKASLDVQKDILSWDRKEPYTFPVPKRTYFDKYEGGRKNAKDTR